MPKIVRLPLMISAILTILLLGNGIAQAAPPPPVSNPLLCTSQFLNNPDYRSQGWVAAEVASVNNVFLGCGDEFSGVVHIASSRSLGTTHPIYASTEGAFLQCFGRLAREGTISQDKFFPNSRDQYQITFLEPGEIIPVHATMIVDREARFVWAMFTNTTERTPRGNNWAGCSGQTAIA